jgi:hypothetical protein
MIRTLLFVHTIISAFSLYRRTVTNYGRPSNLVKYPEGMCGAFTISGVVGSTVQVSMKFALPSLVFQTPASVILCIPTTKTIGPFINCRHMLGSFAREGWSIILYISDHMSSKNGTTIRGRLGLARYCDFVDLSGCGPHDCWVLVLLLMDST